MHGRRRLLRRALLALAALVLLAPAPAHATLPGANGRIAFSAFGEIYTVLPDGSGLAQVKRVDEDEKYDWFPAWSPDGTRITTTGRVLEPPDQYGSRFWTGDDLQFFGADGSAFTRLKTPRQHFSGTASWSPDGKRLVYGTDNEGNGSIYTVNADGTDPRPLVIGEQFSGAFDPAWSPDGEWIAFARVVDEFSSSDLFLIRPDGSDLHRLLERPGIEAGPSWSPDGKSIVFSGSDPLVNSGPAGWYFPNDSLYVLPAAGGEAKRLTTAKHDGSPVFSPDGKLIAFQRDPGGPGGASDMHVWLMNADGGNAHVLTDLSCLQCDPDWQRVAPFPEAPPPTPTPAPPVSAPDRKPVSPLPDFTPLTITGLRLTHSSFTWRARQRVRLSVRLAKPGSIRFTLRRAGATTPLRTVVRRVPAGTSRVTLTRLTPSRLRPGRYTLTAELSGGPTARVSFRVRRAG